MNMFIRRIKLRLRYHYRAIVFGLGYCPDCWTKMKQIEWDGWRVCPNSLNHRRAKR